MQRPRGAWALHRRMRVGQRPLFFQPTPDPELAPELVEGVKGRRRCATPARRTANQPIGSKVIGSIHRGRPDPALAGRLRGGGFSRTQMTDKIKVAVVGLQFGAEFVPIHPGRSPGCFASRRV